MSGVFDMIPEPIRSQLRRDLRQGMNEAVLRLVQECDALTEGAPVGTENTGSTLRECESSIFGLPASQSRLGPPGEVWIFHQDEDGRLTVTKVTGIGDA